MCALSHREASQAGSVELDRIGVIRDIAVFGAGEVNRSLPFIDFIEGADVPITFGYLPDQFSVGSIVINVLPAVTTAKPQKRTVVQPAQTFIDDFNPGLARLAEEICLAAIVRIVGVQVQISLS